MGILAPFRKAGGYLVAPANVPEIRRQWGGIQAMAGSVSQDPRLAGHFVVGADHRIDFEASAAVHRAAAADALLKGAQPQAAYLSMSSITAEELRFVLLPQRRRAAQRACVYGLSCALFTGLWMWKVVSQPVEYTSLFFVVVWLMVVGSLALLAFVELWRNWNLRTGRLAPFIEFFRTQDTWLPS